MVLMFSLLEDSEDSLHPLWVEYFEQTTLLLLSSRSEKYHRTHVKLAFLFFALLAYVSMLIVYYL